MSLNKVMLIGRLGKDVDLRKTNSGMAVASITVATSEKKKDANGQFQEETEWHTCILWGKTAENAATYIKKGSQVYIEGKIGTRSWEKEGVKQYKTEITVFKLDYLDSRKDQEGQAPNNTYGSTPQARPQQGQQYSENQVPENFGASQGQKQGAVPQNQAAVPQNQNNGRPAIQDEELPF